MNKAFLAIAVLFMIGCAFAQQEEVSSLWENNEDRDVSEVEYVREVPARYRPSGVVYDKIRKQYQQNAQLTVCTYKACQFKCRYPVYRFDMDCVVYGACVLERGTAYQNQCVAN